MLGALEQICRVKSGAGEDLFVGTYSQSRYGNELAGVLSKYTPYHVVQNAVSVTTHARGATINLTKTLHGLTRTFSKNADLGTNVKNLAADIRDLRRILADAGYNRSLVNGQLQKLIDLNRKVGNVPP